MLCLLIVLSIFIALPTVEIAIVVIALSRSKRLQRKVFLFCHYPSRAVAKDGRAIRKERAIQKKSSNLRQK